MNKKNENDLSITLKENDKGELDTGETDNARFNKLPQTY
jgi:hypothetical protein